ncbi:amphi-Trp domain-containing protein [Nocardia niigatensis]|uniref:amphi-Trp domain-containing protein n=1 Tax=Nocardia niigatensis TaxID=209249 RepID=UPI0012F6FE4D|nr:amphi-Trp domain-containing protein [Nocardia niigatensis]
MTHKKIYEDHRTLSRPELAAEFERIATELRSGATLTYGQPESAGAITIPDRFDTEIEIQHTKNGAELKFEIEIRFPVVNADLDTVDEASAAPEL